MAVITLDQARAHLREASDYPEEQIAPYMAGAEDAASQYLNRAIYDDATALNEALAALPAALSVARVAYEAAVEAAQAIENLADRADALAVATATFANARADTGRTLNGIVVNPSIVTAVLLTLGHLFANREDVVVGLTATDLPLGARALLRPYRRVMMP